jgi:hypothetical protein
MDFCRRVVRLDFDFLRKVYECRFLGNVGPFSIILTLNLAFA